MNIDIIKMNIMKLEPIRSTRIFSNSTVYEMSNVWTYKKTIVTEYLNVRNGLKITNQVIAQKDKNR